MADRALPAGEELIEEVPLVCWPSSKTLESGAPFCDRCLRILDRPAEVCRPGPRGLSRSEGWGWAALPPFRDLRGGMANGDDARRLARRATARCAGASRTGDVRRQPSLRRCRGWVLRKATQYAIRSPN